MRFTRLLMGLILALEPGAYAVHCAIGDVPPGRPRCLCASVRATCDGQSGWLVYGAIPTDKLVAGSSFDIDTIDLYSSNEDLAPSKTLKSAVPTAAGANSATQPMSCTNPRYYQNKDGSNDITLLKVSGCVEMCYATVVCDVPGKRAETQPATCPKNLDGTCSRTAADCVANTVKFMNAGFVNQSPTAPPAGNLRCTYRSEPFADESYDRYGGFGRVLPANLCGGKAKSVCMAYGDCTTDGTTYSEANLGCAYDGKTCPGANACAADSNVDISTPAPLAAAGGGNKTQPKPGTQTGI